jgi:hypothetical protein
MLVYGESEQLLNNSLHADYGRSIGTYNWDPVVELEYPEAFQKALVKVLDPKKIFRYVYLGGAFTEQDQKKSLWLFTEGRRVRVRPCPLIYNAFHYLWYYVLTSLLGACRDEVPGIWKAKSKYRDVCCEAGRGSAERRNGLTGISFRDVVGSSRESGGGDGRSGCEWRG